MKLDEALEQLHHSLPFDFCLWREVWPDNGPDDCRALLKDSEGSWNVYDSAIKVYAGVIEVSKYELSVEDNEATDWLIG